MATGGAIPVPTINGPTVTAIGWIPYQPLFGSRLPAAYAKHPQALALRAVLRTGNRPEPPPVFRRTVGYLGFIGTYNFRAALCLSDVKLICYPGGVRNAELVATSTDFIGYTPLQIKGRFGKFRYDFVWHEKGDGTIWTEKLSASPNHVTIRRTIEFRVGWLGNLGSRILSGSRAPCAWMSIEYTLCQFGPCRVDIRGSLIPSQSVYESWRRKKRHSMLAINGVQISRFLQTGADLPAPGKLHARF
ncbi:MAG TPA: hypothetical protein VKM54_19040 [Myxococcota bacterium]|nr:hypothetical protein [Myxococcota bacterium]